MPIIVEVLVLISMIAIMGHYQLPVYSTSSTRSVAEPRNRSTTGAGKTLVSSTTDTGSIGFIGSPSELPPDWGAVIVSVPNNYRFGNNVLMARSGEILPIPVELTYRAGPKAPRKAEILLGVKTRGASYIYISIKYIDLDKLRKTSNVLVLRVWTTDLMKIKNKMVRNMIFVKKPYNPIHGKIPVVLIIRSNKPAYIVLRTNDPVRYNVTRITPAANQSRTITMHIWTLGFIKPGYVFEKSNLIGTINLATDKRISYGYQMRPHRFSLHIEPGAFILVIILPNFVYYLSRL